MESDAPRPLLSVVAPCLDEEAAVPRFVTAVLAVLDGLPGPCELILVDDGSTDGTFAAMEAEAARHPGRVRAIGLSRNFGHQMALTAGLDLAEGRAVVTMDADLQHPPEMIPEMVRLWQGGAEVVLTERQGDEDLPYWKRFTSRAFYLVVSSLSTLRIEPGSSDFRLVDRKVVLAMGRCREQHRMLRGLALWVGYRRAVLPYRVGSRVAGRTKFSLGRMLRLALDGIFAFSTVPLRIATLVGMVVAGLSSLYLVYVVVLRFLRPETVVPGWASILGVVLLMGGLQLVFLGIVGEYVGRIFEQVKQRPLYLVARTAGFPAEDHRSGAPT